MLDAMLEEVRSGGSSALVIRGEAGVGETALLDYAAERAAGCRVTRVSGVESESEFAFAGLLQLLAGPLLDQLEQLGGPQRDALKRAFGLIDGPSPVGNRFGWPGRPAGMSGELGDGIAPFPGPAARGSSAQNSMFRSDGQIWGVPGSRGG